MNTPSPSLAPGRVAPSGRGLFPARAFPGRAFFGRALFGLALFSVGLLGLALVSPPARAHDLWIEPADFQPVAGELVEVGLRIGHPGPGAEPVPRNPRHLESFVLRGPDLGPDLGPEGDTPVPGLAGRDPAGWIRPSVPGRYTLALRSRPAISVLPAERFERYLLEEGLEAIRDERARRGESALPGTERYSRSLKALLTVTDPREASSGPAPEQTEVPDRALGLRLELVVRGDPLRLRPGDRLPVELRFEGRPLAGVLVEAHPLGRSASEGPGRSGRHTGVHAGRPQHLAARTDAEGRVTFELPARAPGGPWLLTAVHMFPAPPEVEEDWESVWTALTFSLGAN